MLIDSHHHLWAYDPVQYGWISDEMSVLKRDFQAAELREIASENKIDGFVSVQARQTVEETDALLAIAESTPLIKAVVGWVPLASPEVSSVLDAFQDKKTLRGVRHVVQDEPDDGFLDGKEFNQGVSQLASRGLVYDVLIFGRQLPAAIRFVDRHADLPMVLDHIAKPTVSSGEVDKQWERDFRELARRDNVTCKFSGIVTEVRDETWDIETIRPYWDIACEAFTPDRLMYGSDWPVCLLRSGYSKWLSTSRMLAAELSNNEQAKFFGENAAKAYGFA